MNQAMRTVVDEHAFEASTVETMTKEEIRSLIEEIAIVPAVRAASAEDALFVAETLVEAGIPILEIAMNMPGAIDVLSHVVKHAPKTIVGGGSITNIATAQECLRAGAKFLTSD